MPPAEDKLTMTKVIRRSVFGRKTKLSENTSAEAKQLWLNL